MWRRLVIIVAVLAGGTAGAGLALKSQRVAENLRVRLERLLSRELELDVQIGSLSLDLLPPALEIEGLEVRRPGIDGAWVSLHRGLVSVHPWPSPSGALVIDRLELDGLRADIDLDDLPPALTRGRPPRDPAAIGLPFDVHELALWNVDVHLKKGTAEVSLFRTDVSMAPVDGERRGVSLRIGSGSVQVQGRELGFEAQLEGALQGSLDEPIAFTLDKARIFLKQIAIEGGGSLALRGQPELAFRLAGGASLPRLHELLPDIPLAKGEGRFEIQVSGTPADPVARAKVSIDDLVFEKRELGDLDLDVSVDKHRVRAESFRMAVPRVGSLTGSGALELVPGYPMSVKARLHDTHLPALLELAGLPNSWVRLRLNGDLEAHGKLTSPVFSAKFNGGGSDFAVLDRSYRAPDAVDFVHLAETTLDAEVLLTPQGLSLGHATLRTGQSELVAQGSLSYDPKIGMEMHVGGEHVLLSDLGPVAGVPFEGHGSVAAAIEGPYADPTISATLDIEEMAAMGYAIGDARATLIYNGLVLKLDRVAGRRGEGHFSGRGALDFRHGVARVDAQADLVDVALADLLESGGVPTDVSRRMRAQVTGDISLSGELKNPAGETELRAPSLVVEGASLGAMHFVGGFGKPGRWAYGALTAAAADGKIEARAELASPTQMTLDLKLSGTDIASLRPLMGDADLAGRLSLDAELSGPPEALSGKVSASVPALVAYKTFLAKAHMTALVSDGTMVLSGTLLDGQAKVDGEIKLNRELTYAITALLNGVHATTLWPKLDGIEVVASGNLFSQGALTRGDSILADVELGAMRTSWAGITLDALRPVRLQFAQGDLHVLDMLLSTPGVRLSTAGTWRGDGTLDLKVLGSGDLDAARLVLPKVALSRGHFDLRLAVGGTLDAPSLGGEANVSGGLLRFPQAGLTLEDLEGRVAFAGRSIEIDDGFARMGGGQLRFSGQLLLGDKRDTEVDLRTELSQVTLRPTSDITLTTSGTLNLGGPTSDLLLRGNLGLQSLRYSANIDLERLVPARNAPPLRVPTPDPEHAIRLAVHVSAPNNIIVASNVVEAEFKTDDLVVTGTTERMGLVGSMQPLWARARYQDNVFTVERALISFTDEYRIFTQFDIRARAQACGMALTVDVQGDADAWHVTASGEDTSGAPVGQEEALTCIQFGIRLRDYAGQAGAALTDALPASSLDALWQVSGLDEQVRRYLPIVDDLRLSSGYSIKSKRTTPRVVVGKELGKDVQLTYSRAIDEFEDQLLSVEYRLNNTATMQGTWNSASDAQRGDFGLDLRLRWEFQ